MTTAHFDDIVVGSGAAGAVVAARLSEDSARRVLLLEAGPDYPTLAAIPRELRDRRRPQMVAYGWDYQASPLAGREMHYPRGKVIGGSTTVNGAVALRGAPEDFDEWASLGATGWSWYDVLPSFRRLEDDEIVSPFHGQGGPIPIRRSAAIAPFSVAFLAACRDLGFPESDDLNAPDATGVGRIPLNIDGETRVSTAIGYLLPARSRPNLTIRGGCLVDRVLFDGDRANGLVVLTDSGEERLTGDQIILAAGAIGSPAILLRSGIGPADSLRALGVGVRTELPGVGENLIDHPASGFLLRPRPGALDPGSPPFETVLRFSSPGSNERNDLQILPYYNTDRSRFPVAVAGEWPVAASFSVQIERPRSRGRLTLRSTDPHDQPQIDLRFLEDHHDIERLVYAMQLALRIARSAPFAEICDGIAGIEDAVFDSDDALGRFLRERVSNALHPVGTARMGSDSRAVVDPTGRVIGLRSLFVVDASIMPSIPRANTNLTCIMIGERMADLLRH